MNDIVPCNIEEVLEKTKDLDIKVNYEWKNDLHLELNENDSVFDIILDMNLVTVQNQYLKKKQIIETRIQT